MSAVVLPFARALPVPRIEISSPGFTRDGKRIYFVGIVEADGCLDVWSGADLEAGYEAAAYCAASEKVPILDLTNPSEVWQ